MGRQLTTRPGALAAGGSDACRGVFAPKSADAWPPPAHCARV